MLHIICAFFLYQTFFLLVRMSLPTIAQCIANLLQGLYQGSIQSLPTVAQYIKEAHQHQFKYHIRGAKAVHHWKVPFVNQSG